jgi:hypothetical protein
MKCSCETLRSLRRSPRHLVTKACGVWVGSDGICYSAGWILAYPGMPRMGRTCHRCSTSMTCTLVPIRVPHQVPAILLGDIERLICTVEQGRKVTITARHGGDPLADGQVELVAIVRHLR